MFCVVRNIMMCLLLAVTLPATGQTLKAHSQSQNQSQNEKHLQHQDSLLSDQNLESVVPQRASFQEHLKKRKAVVVVPAPPPPPGPDPIPPKKP